MSAATAFQRMALAAACIALPAVASEPSPSFLFVDFEPKGGWREGPLLEDNLSVVVSQGSAQIVPQAEPDSKQVLQLDPSDPFTAVFIDAAPLSDHQMIFCETLARPIAVQGDDDGEFLDFGGAILGCFREGNQGEIQALYGKTEQESVWISTGIRFELDEAGRPAEWLRLTIEQDRATQRWTLTINGMAVLSGLATVLPPEGSPRLWLYGEKVGTSLFDDILISALHPDILEKDLEHRENTRLRTSEVAVRTGQPQRVTQAKPLSELRQTRTALKVVPSTERPVVRGWSVSLDTGNATRSWSWDARTRDTGEPGIAPYAPGYDDEGNRLPLETTITADVELKPGTDLRQLRWQICELIKWPAEYGEIIAEGDFSSGLVQKHTLSPELTKKATLVRVWTER